ncbi:MAG: tripartite tricarboxylate transporter substrate binding protein, partial [Betaproteobacteria bacterium]
MKWLCILAFATSTAFAQTYPAKPVRVIVPFPPGGTADLLARTTAQKLSASLGQQFVVESRAGAGGNLGAEFVFRAEPDGYTLLASPPHLLTVNPLLYKLSFDPLKFVPIGIIAAYPNV